MMIEMVLHEAYTVQLSHHMNQTMVVVMKAQGQNRYLMIYSPYNASRSLISHLRGEPWENVIDASKRTEDVVSIEYLQIKRCDNSFNIFIKFRDGKMDERDNGMQNEKLGTYGIAWAMRRNLPILTDQDLLDEFGVDGPALSNPQIVSTQPLDRCKKFG